MASPRENGPGQPAPPAAGPAPAAHADHWEQLAPGVRRRRLPGWDATAGAVADPAGVLLIDAGSSPAEGAGLRAGLRGLCGADVTDVVLTHPHFDHVLGAAAFPEARVHGPQGMAEYLGRAGGRLEREAVEEGMPAETAAAAARSLVLPEHQVAGEVALRRGGREIVLVDMGPAHSPCDLAVLVRPAADGPAVVFCGDLVEESGEPQAGPDASPALWPAALDRLLALGGEDALYVPGHGAVVGAGFVRAQRDVIARRFATS